MADLSALSDEYLNEMRGEAKFKVGATRCKVKGRHIEQQFELESNSGNRRYRVFTRQHVELSGAFSVGLCLVQPGGDDLVLCRYNGYFHSHKNVVEGERVPAGPHVHVATQRYIESGLKLDGYAFQTDRYSTMRGALLCLVGDCGIGGILDPDEPEPLSLFT